ncbi:heparinase II/III domain-containing protein, partial [Brachybacterium tyrofermentans]|uniref:heparinase II/III domain-containing protein n=2 Tax=Brachybacterium tyrofermentans TaxID=47848 RepID=UPI003FCFCE14
MQIRLPNSHTFVIDEHYFPVDWSPHFPSDNASTRLWHRSLAYLPAITRTPGGWALVESLLADFTTFTSDASNPIRIPSLDHALAIQIRVCHELLFWAERETPPRNTVRELIDNLLPKLLDLAREPGMRVSNNHGVMLSVALLLISSHHPHLVPDTEAVSDAEVAAEQIGSIFDADGLSHENTASYQGLYVRLLRDLCEIADESKRLSPAAALFRQTYSLASDAYRRQLLPDGHVPPLGDGGMGKELDLTPIAGKLVSPNNGLYIHSDTQSYLSVTCGARSPIHKQMDDTSIMMSAAGRLLVLDAGVHNYDPENKQAAQIRTQLGHSGLFFPKFDDQPLKFFNTGGEHGGRKVYATMDARSTESMDHIFCEYSLEGHQVRREVRTNSPTSATLLDQAWSPDGSAAVARFLVDRSLKLSSSAGRLEGSDGSAWVRLTFPPSIHCTISDGLISWSLRERQPCWTIEIPVPAGGRKSILGIETGAERAAPGSFTK